MSRAAAETIEELGQGIASLATISTIAPWLGVIATVDGIVGAFGGGSGEKSAMMAAVTMRLSEAIWPTAMGLAVGILAFVFHRHLSPQFAVLRRQTLFLDAEMAALLAPYRSTSPHFPTSVNTHSLATFVILTFAWITQSLAYVVHYGYYPQWAFFRASWYIGFLFTICIAPISVIWVRASGCSRETLGLITAFMCLIWSIVECVLGLHLL